MDTINRSNKHKYLLIMTGVFVAILGFGLGRFSGHPAPDHEPRENKVPAPISDNRTFFWEIYPELIIPNTGKKINSNLSLLDSNDRSIPLAKLPADFPLLVFRYSKFDCHVCVNQVLQKLAKLFKGREKQVCLLVDGYSARELRIKYKDSGLTFPIYILDKDKLGLSMENKNLPFLFTFENRNFQVNKIFVPFKEHSGQTDTYLQNIVAYFEE